VTNDTDLVLLFDATQEARHAAVLRVNEMAKAMVERARARVAGMQPDADGVLPEPRRLRITLGEDVEPITVKQLRFLHGPVFGQISEQVVVEGVRFTKAVWKRHLKDLFLPDEFEMVRGLVLDTKTGRMRLAKRATPRKREKSLADLTVKQCSEFIDKVLAHGATEWGVEWSLDPAEREAVRYVRPVRAKKAQEVQA
jgi:hypothetical protein